MKSWEKDIRMYSREKSPLGIKARLLEKFSLAYPKPHNVSQPPLLISASNLRAIVVGIPWCSQTSLKSLSYLFWLRDSCLPRLNPGSTSPYLSRYGASIHDPDAVGLLSTTFKGLGLPLLSYRYATKHFRMFRNNPTSLPHLKENQHTTTSEPRGRFAD